MYRDKRTCTDTHMHRDKHTHLQRQAHKNVQRQAHMYRDKNTCTETRTHVQRQEHIYRDKNTHMYQILDWSPLTTKIPVGHEMDTKIPTGARRKSKDCIPVACLVAMYSHHASCETFWV